jgi:stage V sporulation protein S
MDSGSVLPIEQFPIERPEEFCVKVKANGDPGKIAGSIAHAIQEGRQVSVRAIGASAVNQALKACIVARGYVAPKGMNLSIIPGFDMTPDDHVLDRDTNVVVLAIVISRH